MAWGLPSFSRALVKWQKWTGEQPAVSRWSDQGSMGIKQYRSKSVTGKGPGWDR